MNSSHSLLNRYVSVYVAIADGYNYKICFYRSALASAMVYRLTVAVSINS